MIETLLAKMFQLEGAFSHPLVVVLCLALCFALLLTPLLLWTMSRRPSADPAMAQELRARYFSWIILVPVMAGPVLLGPGCVILAIGILSLLCHAEFARATGLFRFRLISLVVVLGIVALAFAEMDHWYGLFAALPSLVICLLVIVGLFRDEPSGYIQRVALGIFSFLLFGVCIGHLGYIANDRDFRPLILAILVCVELNDIFAFICGKLFGRLRLAPKTSPNKTIEGALGAVVMTTALFATLGHFIFAGGILDRPVHLLAMGLILAVTGQFGDLVISSVKRDVGVKDMGAVLPGHGGLLDRFDSLLLVAPAIFHYVGYFRGIGLDQPLRLFTG